MALIGYARVSTEDQSLELQLQALHKRGVVKSNIFNEKAGGVDPVANRQQWDYCLARLTKGDTLVVWRLDRIGRSLQHLIEIVETLRERGVQLVSITENIDTSTPQGELMFHITGAFAQFERALIQERVKAGMAAARASGKHVGRKQSMTPTQINMAVSLLESGKSAYEIGDAFDVSYKTVQRAVKRAMASQAVEMSTL